MTPKKLDCLDLLFPRQTNRNAQFGIRQHLTKETAVPPTILIIHHFKTVLEILLT